MYLQNDTEATTPTDDAVEVVRHVERPVSEVWARLTTKEGIEAFLGEGAMLGAKGDPWHAADGTRGVTRSYHPDEQIRVSWHADEDAPATLVDLQMKAEGEGTLLTLRHEHLDASADHAALRQRWENALQRLTES